MARLCPRCKGSIDTEPQCPTCGYSLLAPEMRRPIRGRSGSDGTSRWQQTPLGKTAIGLVVALGLWFTLLFLVRAILAASGQNTQTFMSSFNGLLLMQGLQLVALMIGGMLAGAGQPQGTMLGGAVGIGNAVLFAMVQIGLFKQEISIPVLLVLLILQIAFGITGGFAGTKIWKPIQLAAAIAAPTEPEVPERIKFPIRKEPMFAGPISWIRVLIGSAVVVLFTQGGYSILKGLIDFSGKGNLDTQKQGQLLLFEISVLATIAGGVIGGSNNSNGIKQGLVVGIIASLVLNAINIYMGESTSTASTSTAALALFGFEQTALIQKVIFTFLSVICWGIVGGWFGSQLMPPVVLLPRRQRMLPGSMS
jgi:hypothetical protein